MKSVLAVLLLLLVIPGAAMAQTYSAPCTNGPVNAYFNGGGYPDTNPPEDCEYVINVDVRDASWPGGWMQLDEVQVIWSIQHVRWLMYLTHECGIIVHGPGGWSSPGQMYIDDLRLTATRLPPCTSLTGKE